MRQMRTSFAVLIVCFSLIFSPALAFASLTESLAIGVGAFALGVLTGGSSRGNEGSMAVRRQTRVLDKRLKAISNKLNNLKHLPAILEAQRTSSHNLEGLVNSAGHIMLPRELSNTKVSIDLETVYKIYEDILSGSNKTASSLNLNHEDILILLATVSPENIFLKNEQVQKALNKYAKLSRQDSLSTTDLYKSLIVTLVAQEVSQKAFSENTENTVVNATREASQLFFLPTAIGVFSEIQGSNQYWSMDPDKVAEMARDLVKKLENHKGTQEQKEQIVKNFLEQSGLESNTEQMDNALLAVKSVTENLPVETISTLDKLHNEKLKRFFAENGESLINDLENSKGEIAFFIRDDAATNNYRIKKIQDKIDGTYSGGPPDEVIAIFLPVFAMIPIAILAMDSSAASFIYDNPFLYYAGFASLIYGTLKIFRKKYHPGLQQISQIKMEIANNEKSLTTDLSRIELKQRAAKNEITSIDEIIDNYYRASICDGVLSRVK